MIHDTAKANDMAMQKSATLAFLAVGATTLIFIALVSAALVTNRTITNTGTIKTVGVGVYWDSACTNATSSIDWGTLAPNQTAISKVYVKSNSTIPVTLSLSSGNWSPTSASGYLTPGWNCTGYVLGKGLVVAAALTLAVSANITGVTSFSFDMTITGSE
jgi:hypothetical protein